MAAWVLLLGLVLTGCSSSFEPARSPRIVTVVKGGVPHFVKDGTDYGSPMFGTGLVDAVQGNPRAASEARSARNLTIAGFVFDLAGIAGETAGLVVLEQQRRPSGAAAALTVGGLTSLLIGTVLLLNAPAHTYDAVNIYNDGLGREGLGPRSFQVSNQTQARRVGN